MQEGVAINIWWVGWGGGVGGGGLYGSVLSLLSVWMNVAVCDSVRLFAAWRGSCVLLCVAVCSRPWLCLTVCGCASLYMALYGSV